ncbi:metal ABC transporter substrate-binding protein [Myxacorys almedinensis]|uniref:Zinc ABC transporter solute-binding protein n=1 Tax=Myxacorys almedinensis A TaxID=2690445 RepID=A0A8J7Z113_9CYAN|nr:metal ABC transporter substrate-binding protein [Myxacorys almedinensis]NDJ17170.1 zinc ABC transporter solute-binding protein [Myxacorys almedinensis A]
MSRNWLRQARKDRLYQLVAAILVTGTVAGCNSPTTPPQATGTAQPQAASPAQQNNKLRVTATFLPVYLFTKAVAGDAAQVDILVKPGTEVHEYQSTPDDVKALAQTDLVVQNGLGIEEFLDGTIKSAQNPNLKVIDASQGIKPIGETSQVVQARKEGDHDHSHSHDAGNPHVWLDPVLAKQQVENIRDGLVAADPVNKATYEANAAAYIQQLDALNQTYEKTLNNYRDRTFITFHDAFPYLAQRYNLNQVAVVELPEDQLAPEDVTNTVNAVKQFDAKALLSEPGVDNKLLDSLSKDLNLTLRPLDSLETGETDPQYYFTAMNANLKNLEAAFK